MNNNNQELQKVYYDEEDEIDLLEMFKKLINFIFDNIKLIILTTLITTMLFAILGKFLSKATREISANIKISQTVANTGKFPNGEAFNKNTLISKSDLKKAYEEYGFNEDFKDYKKFEDSITIKEIPIDSKLVEKGIKSQEYRITFGYSNVEKGEDFLKDLIVETIKENKEKQKEIIVDTKVEDILRFDYIDRAEKVETYAKEIEMRIKNIKNSSISETDKKELKVAEDMLYRLVNENIFNYSSYLLQNKLTNNLVAFKLNSSNRIYKLEEDIKRLQDKILVLKDVIEVYKMQVSRDSSSAITTDKYYSELINEYKELNNQLLSMKTNLELYKKYVATVRGTTEKEDAQLTANLTEIMTELNNIKAVVDKASSNYYNKIYSDLIILNDNIEAKSKVKASIVLILGVFLGFLLGMFIAFIKDMKK